VLLLVLLLLLLPRGWRLLVVSTYHKSDPSLYLAVARSARPSNQKLPRACPRLDPVGQASWVIKISPFF
jgi:hypothetical protein